MILQAYSGSRRYWGTLLFYLFLNQPPTTNHNLLITLHADIKYKRAPAPGGIGAYQYGFLTFFFYHRRFLSQVISRVVTSCTFNSIIKACSGPWRYWGISRIFFFLLGCLLFAWLRLLTDWHKKKHPRAKFDMIGTEIRTRNARVAESLPGSRLLKPAMQNSNVCTNAHN